MYFRWGTLARGVARGTDRRPASRAAAAAGARPPWQAAWASADGPVPCRYCSVTLPVSAGGSVHQTLNIQRADCGRGKVALWQAWGPCGGGGLGGQVECPRLWGLTSAYPGRGHPPVEGAVCRGREAARRLWESSVSPKGQGARPSKERKEGKGLLRPRGGLLEGNTPPCLQGLRREAEARVPRGSASRVRPRAAVGSEAPAAPGPRPPLQPLKRPSPGPRGHPDGGHRCRGWPALPRGSAWPCPLPPAARAPRPPWPA